ncbi:MAG: hypothetical protein IJE97_08920, partial [Thermoguttaceae bacterium]|nr:hypothetical protein [Thermoguttaceae bacterium]
AGSSRIGFRHFTQLPKINVCSIFLRKSPPLKTERPSESSISFQPLSPTCLSTRTRRVEKRRYYTTKTLL